MKYLFYGAIAALAVGAVTALTPQAKADENASKEAPDYFVQAVFDATTAEQLATFCPEVDLNVTHANAASEALLTQLSDDGYGDVTDFETLTGVEERVGVLQDAFVKKYDLGAPDQAKVCGAAKTELANNSSLGAYFVEVTQ